MYDRLEEVVDTTSKTEVVVGAELAGLVLARAEAVF